MILICSVGDHHNLANDSDSTSENESTEDAFVDVKNHDGYASVDPVSARQYVDQVFDNETLEGVHLLLLTPHSSKRDNTCNQSKQQLHPLLLQPGHCNPIAFFDYPDLCAKSQVTIWLIRQRRTQQIFWRWTVFIDIIAKALVNFNVWGGGGADDHYVLIIWDSVSGHFESGNEFGCKSVWENSEKKTWTMCFRNWIFGLKITMTTALIQCWLSSCLLSERFLSQIMRKWKNIFCITCALMTNIMACRRAPSADVKKSYYGGRTKPWFVGRSSVLHRRYIQANLWRILGIFVLAADSSHHQQTYHILSLGYDDTNNNNQVALKHKTIIIPYRLAPASKEMVENPAEIC